MTNHAIETVWAALKEIDRFLQYDFDNIVQESVVLSPEEWKPIHEAAGIIRLNRFDIPDMLNNLADLAIQTLEVNLNKFLQALRDMLKARESGDKANEEAFFQEAVRILVEAK